MTERNYIVFRRSARNFEQFGNARKVIVRRKLTLEEARSMCREYNDNRTTTQIAAGTKLEFTTGNV